MLPSIPSLSLFIALSLNGALLSAQTAAPDTLERPITAGTTLRLKLPAGGYRIKAGTDQDTIRMSWRTESAWASARVEISLDTHGSVSLLTAKAPQRKDFEMDIEVPARMDLDVDMSVGDLTISGIEGHKKIDLNVGDIKIDIGKAEAYQRVRASLKIGDIDASPFQAHHEGFFRSLKWNGPGTYHLDVRLGIGDITLK